MPEQKKITIVFYDEGAPGPNPLGGGQVARINLMAGMDKSKFRPILLTSIRNELPKAAEKKGVEVLVHPVNPGFRRFDRTALLKNPANLARVLSKGVAASVRLARILKKLEADIVNPNENLSRVVTLFAKPFHKVPAVCHIDNEWDKGLVDEIMGRLFTSGFDRLIAVSSRVREIAQRYTEDNEKIVTIPTGVNTEPFMNCSGGRLAQIVKSAGSRFNICTVGKLIRFKGQHLVIKILSEIANRLPPFNYIIIGDGPDRDELQGYVRSLKMEDVVHFLGFRKDVPDILCDMDLLIQPSETESWGLAVLEGMMAGLPVIATDVGGAREIMDNGKLGWLVKPNDNKDIASAILDVTAMQEDERRQKGQKARNFAMKHYSFDQTVKLTEQVYLSMVDKTSFVAGRS